MRICSYPGWRLDAAAPKPGSEALISATLDLKELRNQRLNNRMLHQRRPEAYRTLTETWQPWKAYPDLKPFTYPSATTSSNRLQDEARTLPVSQRPLLDRWGASPSAAVEYGFLRRGGWVGHFRALAEESGIATGVTYGALTRETKVPVFERKSFYGVPFDPSA